MKILDLLEKLLSVSSVSGTEFNKAEKFIQDCIPYSSEVKADGLGNILLVRRGNGAKKKKILLEAHRDTVGLLVSKIHEGGFASVASSGGLDCSLIPGTMFRVHSEKDYVSIAASTPPHLSVKGEKNSKIKMDDIYLDLPFETKTEAEKHVKIGDPITFAAKAEKMANGFITSPYLDNFASVIALLFAINSIQNPYNDLMFFFSVGEETTSRGVRTFFGNNVPDVAFVFDAGFGFEEGMNSAGSIQMGSGPSLSFTDTLSRELELFAYDFFKQKNVKFQTVAEPGGTGTSATAIQTLCGGVPSCVISIPVFNMHTPSEILCEDDVFAAVELIKEIADCDKLPSGEVRYV